MRSETLKLSQVLILPFDKWWKFLLGNLIVALFVITVFFPSAFNTWTRFGISLVWSLTISISQWIGHVLITHYINKKIPIFYQPAKHSILSLICMSFYAVIAFVGVQILMHYIFFGGISQLVLNKLLRTGYVPIAIAVGISLFFSARGYFLAWRKSVFEVERLKTEMLTYKYESLRNQINPHFLFNSFNVLTDLIYSDQKQAVDFVQKMSGLFRYVLDSRDKELVPLKEELGFIDSFISLLNTRFNSKLKVDNQLTAKDDDLIVPMSLQLLIENAVKHNEISKAHPLKIKIFRSGNRIEVWNNLKLKNIGEHSNKLGLKNIQQQYVFFTDEKIEIQKGEDYFSVRLPLLKAEKQ